MRIQTFLPCRAGVMWLAALALAGFLGFDSTPAAAWTKEMNARQLRYLACTERIKKEPPCNQWWTRYCARQCHARYY